jgi:hypothetical protein
MNLKAFLCASALRATAHQAYHTSTGSLPKFSRIIAIEITTVDIWN